MTTLYSRDHEWIHMEAEQGIMGITRYAVDQLGDITFVELPRIGTTVRQGDVLCTIESVKAASDVYAPLSGTVTEVNSCLVDAPELVNQSAEEAAWLVRLQLSDPEAEQTNLLDRAGYDSYLAELS